MSNLIQKFEEIKRVGIIKDFKPVYREDELIDIDIEFYDKIPPERALRELDLYLAKKGVIS